MPLLGKRKKEDGEEDLTALKPGKSDGLFSDAFSSLSRTGRVRKKSAKLMEMESMGNMEAPDDSEEKLNRNLKFNQNNFNILGPNISHLNHNEAFQGKIFSTINPAQANINNMVLNNMKIVQGTSNLCDMQKTDNMNRLVVNQNLIANLSKGTPINIPKASASVNPPNSVLIRGQMYNLQTTTNLQKPQQMILIRNSNPQTLRPQQLPYQTAQTNLQNKNMLTLNTLNTMKQASPLKTNIAGNLNSHLILKGDPFLNQHSSLGVGTGTRFVNLGNTRLPISVSTQGVINMNNMIKPRNVMPGSNNNIQFTNLNLVGKNIQFINDPRKFQVAGLGNNQLANFRGFIGSQNDSQKFTDVFANFVTQPTKDNMSNRMSMDHHTSPNKIMSAFSNINEESLDNDLDEDLDLNDQELQSLIIEGGGSLNDSLSAQFGLTPKGAKKRKKITAYTLWCVNQRKNLRPGLEFGQISKILGDAWSALPHKEKLGWKRRAKKMTEKFQASLALEPASTGPVKKRHYTPRRSSNQPMKRGKYKKRGVNNQSLSGDDSYNPGNQINRHGYEMNYTFKVSGTEAIDAAAYLKLLGECLSNLGERLMEHVGQIAVQGSLSVLLDSLICALGPLMCLTSYIPCHVQSVICDETEVGKSADRGDEVVITYVMDMVEGSSSKLVMSNILDNIAYIMPGL